MKKFIIVLLNIFVLVGICSCSKKEVVEEVPEEYAPSYVDDRTYIDSLEYQIGTNLPTISINEKFIVLKLTDDDLANDMQAAFETLNGDLMIVVYRYNRNGYTLEDSLNLLIDAYYQEQELLGSVFNNWEGTNVRYGYYMAYDNDSYDYPCYIQTYLFEDGDDLVEVDYWNKAERVNIINGLSFALPLTLMKEETLSDEDKENGAFLKYVCESKELADLCFYKIETSMQNNQVFLNDFSKKHNVVNSEDYSYEYEGVEFNNMKIEYTDSNNAYHYVFAQFDIDAYYYADYEVNTSSDYRTISIPSLLFSIE